jgi:NitT/TauT family transport system permease protein
VEENSGSGKTGLDYIRKARRPHWADSTPGKILLGLVIPLLLVFAWWLGIRSGSPVVPTFGKVWYVLTHPAETPEDLYSRSLAFSTQMTVLRLALGFGLGVVSGVALGLWAARSRVIERLLYPVVQMAKPINPIVLLPIMTVLFGLSSIGTMLYGEAEAWRHDVIDQIQIAMIAILWWGAFFPIFISTVHGVRAVRRQHLETIGLMGATGAQAMRKVMLPHALPYIANGMRIALGVTWLVLIAAEIFPGTRSGLGYMLCVACKTSDYHYTFAAIAVIGAVGLLMDAALHEFEKRVGHWQARER